MYFFYVFFSVVRNHSILATALFRGFKFETKIMAVNFKQHWEQVYFSKEPHQVSWTQDTPQTSLDFIQAFELDKSARIIDVGGGDSKLVDHLLDVGFENVHVLDISGKALEKAQKRLGERAAMVTWIESDIREFVPKTACKGWHDRALFHFLTYKSDIAKYVELVNACASNYLTIGTFSNNGPEACSGLQVKQYGESELTELFKARFEKLECFSRDHITPSGSVQNFLFCSFKRKF